MRKNFVKNVFQILIMATISVWFVVSIDKLSTQMESEELERLEVSINKAMITCYSIEGFYPNSVDYLVDNYGIIINDEKYYIHYSTFASNMKPVVRIIKRTAYDKE